MCYSSSYLYMKWYVLFFVLTEQFISLADLSTSSFSLSLLSIYFIFHTFLRITNNINYTHEANS